MFTMDLLKGQGRPIRTKPQGVALFVATFTVPVLIAMLMVGYYTRNNVIISVQKQTVKNLDVQIQRLADALKFRESCEREKNATNKCLADVASSLSNHVQWSSVLVSLVENMPDSVVLNSLEVKRSVLKQKIAAAGNPAQKIDSSVVVRTLKMRVSGNPNANCDLDVKTFRDQLMASKDLGPKLENVAIASQGRDLLDGLDAVAYDIDCIFKPGM